MNRKHEFISDQLDPDPYSIAFSFFAALTGGASLSIAITNKMRDSAQAQSEARRFLFSIDRALTRLDDAYRNLLSIYEQHDILDQKIELGLHPLMLDQVQRTELRNLHSDIFHAGQDLQDSLADLSAVAGFRDSQTALKLARTLNRLFEKARRSRNLINFMIGIGSMLIALTRFVNYVGQYYAYDSDLERLPILQNLVRTLKSRKLRG
jgi:hypothetical protein